MPRQDGLFDFESGYAGDLRFMPLAIRYRLDLAGLKLGLDAWRGLSLETRRRLLALSGEGGGDVPAFRGELLDACLAHGVEAPAPVPALDPAAWSVAGGPPAEAGDSPRLADAWPGLDEFRRYALVKLARSRREPEALGRALREFLGEA